MIDIKYSYMESKRGVLCHTFQDVEERTTFENTEDALKAISACLRHMRKCRESTLHVSVDGVTLSIYPDSFSEWENGIIKTHISRAWNDVDKETLTTFEKAKKQVKIFISSDMN